MTLISKVFLLMAHRIAQFETLAITPVRRAILSALETMWDELQPHKVVTRSVVRKGSQLCVGERTFELDEFRRVIVVSFGKMAHGIAVSLERIIGDRMTSGFSIDTQATPVIPRFHQVQGTHPLPSHTNVDFSAGVIKHLTGLTEKDLVIVAISGGGSALFAYPYESEGIEGPRLFSALTRAGAPIAELNTVRKHLSLVKGGGLSKIAYPATVIGLLFSDVIGNDPSVIASGPTVLDQTTIADAKKVCARYKVPEPAHWIETSKDAQYFSKTNNFMLLSSHDALASLQTELASKGFSVRILTEVFSHEARVAGRYMLDRVNPNELLLAVGETLVTITGSGTGGRNQEAALGALIDLKPREVFCACSSDGIDFTEAAGAIVDEHTKQRVLAQRLDMADYLRQNDSFTFFKKAGDQIITGATEVNIADVFIAYRSAEGS